MIKECLTYLCIDTHFSFCTTSASISWIKPFPIQKIWPEIEETSVLQKVIKLKINSFLFNTQSGSAGTFGYFSGFLPQVQNKWPPTRGILTNKQMSFLAEHDTVVGPSESSEVHLRWCYPTKIPSDSGRGDDTDMFLSFTQESLNINKTCRFFRAAAAVHPVCRPTQTPKAVASHRHATPPPPRLKVIQPLRIWTGASQMLESNKPQSNAPLVSRENKLKYFSNISRFMPFLDRTPSAG